MSKAALDGVLHMIRRVGEVHDARNISDEDLLRRFAMSGDESSYRAIVHRHGAMVLDVCRAVLPNEADAEDAFQATFLVLARKARSIRKGASLASWLHGVACRTARKARVSFAIRREHESRAPIRQPEGTDDPAWSEVRWLLHQELAALSERHRAPLVSCYLQGMTQDEAASALGLSRGTLRRRLEAGQRTLRLRLIRRGVGPMGVVLLSSWPAPAALPVHLEMTVVQIASQGLTGSAAAGVLLPRAAGLADSVMRALFLAQLRVVAAVVLLVGAMGLVGVTLLHGGNAFVEPPPAMNRSATEAERRQQALSIEVDQTVARLRDMTVRRGSGADSLGLFLMDVRGREVIAVAGEVEKGRAYCGSPSWSSDGRKIIFDATPGQQWNRTVIQMLDGREKAPVPRSLGVGNGPTLSSDGKSLAYFLQPNADLGRDPGLHIVDTEGGEPRYLGGSGIPKWSPDGRRLLVVRFSSPCELTLVNVENGEGRAIALAAHRFFSVPSWGGADTIVAVVNSTAGTRIALVDVSDPGEAKIKKTIWRRDAKLPVDPAYPVYDPATGRCLFVGREKQGQALYAIDPGDGPRPLEPGRFDGKIASLALSPDGRYVLFASDRP